MRAGLLVACVVCAVLLPGCGSPSGSSTSSTATVTAAASNAQPAVSLSPGQRFVKEFLSYPGLSTTMSESELIGLADKVCDAIGTPGIARQTLVDAIGTSKLGPTVAPVLVDTANRAYCPEKTWSTAPVVEYTPGGSASPAESGPVTTVSAGTYEVGTGDGQVPPGRYKSSGPTGSGPCYFARLKNGDGELGDIIDNDVSQGPSILNVKSSDGFVKVSGCTFIKAS